MEEERLQKFIANQGICSRRKAEEYITSGRIKVNGNTVIELGTKINSAKDIVEIDGKKISNITGKKVYRDTVLDLVKVKEKVLPVGRLDMYTSGAIILSNDGEFIYKITHPKYEVEKTYNVTLKGQITDEEVEKLKNGVQIEDYITGKAKVKILRIDKEKSLSRVEIIIHEGKNREVRKMCEAIGRKVLALHRTKIGNISVKDLRLGTWRYLKPNEIKSLLDI